MRECFLERVKLRKIKNTRTVRHMPVEGNVWARHVERNSGDLGPGSQVSWDLWPADRTQLGVGLRQHSVYSKGEGGREEERGRGRVKKRRRGQIYGEEKNCEREREIDR